MAVVSAVCSLAETREFGRRLGQVLRTLDLVLLRGPVGSGKSTLARSVIRAAVEDPDAVVPSPTFLLALQYSSPRRSLGRVTHMDLHRLYKDSVRDTDTMPGWFATEEQGPETLLADSDVAPLGWHDAIASGAVLCEWPHGLSRDSIYGHIGVTPRYPLLITIEPESRPDAAASAPAAPVTEDDGRGGVDATGRGSDLGLAAAAAAARSLSDDEPRRITLHASYGRWERLLGLLAGPVTRSDEG